MISRQQKSRGFTLLELLVVVVIIGLLASYVAPRYFSQVEKSEIKVARAQIDALEKALDLDQRGQVRIKIRVATFMRQEAIERGTMFTVRGGDSIDRILIQYPGAMNNVAGRWEYMFQTGHVTHQRFVAGGRINGIPNKP